MTKHRKPEEWIETILEAAAAEVDESGYHRLTMDAIAARAGASKGGVYRFFSNKSDVALALFTRMYRAFVEREITGEEVVAWRLPIAETITRLMFWPETIDAVAREQRIWVELLPLAVRDERFRAERRRLLDNAVGNVKLLVRLIAERDALTLPDDIDRSMEAALMMGISLTEGLIVQGVTGTPIERQVDLARGFIEVLAEKTFGGSDER